MKQSVVLTLGIMLSLTGMHAKEPGPTSPDGTRHIEFVPQQPVKLWDTQSRQVLTVLKPEHRPASEDPWSPDSRYFITISQADNTATVWNAVTGSKVKVVREQSPIYRANFESNTQFSVSTQQGKTVYTTPSEGVVHQPVLGAKRPREQARAYSPNGRLALSADNNGVTVQNTRSGATLAQVSHKGAHFIRWNHAGTRFVTTGGKEARVWSKLGKLLYTLKEIKLLGKAIFSPNDSLIVTCTSEARYTSSDASLLATEVYGEAPVKIWDARTGNLIGALPSDEHLYNLNQTPWSPDGRYLVTVSEQAGTATIWEARTGSKVDIVRMPEIYAAYFTSDSEIMIQTAQGSTRHTIAGQPPQAKRRRRQ